LDPRFPLLSCKNIHSEEKEKRNWNWNKDSDLMEKRPLIASTPLFLKSVKALSLFKLSVETLSPCLAPFVFSRCQQRSFSFCGSHLTLLEGPYCVICSLSLVFQNQASTWYINCLLIRDI